MSGTPAIGQDQSFVLAGQICAAAGLSAQSTCGLLDLIGEFDAGGAVGWWTDVKSVAHWLAWSCAVLSVRDAVRS